MPLFHNEYFQIGSKHFFNPELYLFGFRYVKDMLKENGDFKNWDDIKINSSNKINFLTFKLIMVFNQSIFFFFFFKIQNRCLHAVPEDES